MTELAGEAAGLWWAWWGPAAVQGSLLVAALLLVDLLPRRWLPPESRELLWIAVPLALLLPAALPGSWLPSGFLPAWPAPRDRLVPGAPGLLLPAVWLGGMVALAIAGTARSRSLRRQRLAGARAVRGPVLEEVHCCARALGLRRVPRVLRAPCAAGPMLLGGLRPRVLLPPEVLQAHPADLRHVLLHELGHQRRHDPLLARLWVTTQLLFWMHPLVHLAAHRAARLREVGCDRLAAGCTGDPGAYARTLAGLGAVPGSRAAALTWLRRRSDLRHRLQWLLHAPPARRCLARALATVLLPMLLACTLPPGPSPAPGDTSHPAPELPGCLQLRFLVLRELARQDTDP